MNKICIMIVLIAVNITAFAQTEKGRSNLGLGFGYNNTKNNLTYSEPGKQDMEFSTKSYYIGPSYSYFIANNLDVGLQVAYNYGLNKSTVTGGTNKSKINGLYSAIVLRKYLLFQNKIGVRAGPYAGYQTVDIKNDQPDYSGTTTYRTYMAGINLDLVYYPSPNIGLAAGLAGLNYQHQKSGGDFSRGSRNELSLAFTNSVNFSVYYVFGN